MKKLLKKILRVPHAKAYFWKEYFISGEAELLLLNALVPRNKIAIDVGGNLGTYAYHLSRFAARVIVFEPNPDFIREMTQRGISTKQIQQVALSDSDGMAVLRIPHTDSHGEDAGMGSLEESAVSEAATARSMEVPRRTLDSYHFSSVGFIKIDVEGHEEAVLRGAIKTIEASRPNLLIEIEERHSPGSLARICEMLIPLGYTCTFVRNGKRTSITEFDAVNDQTLQLLNLKSTRRRTSPYINNFIFSQMP